jgi:hypothetical protein
MKRDSIGTVGAMLLGVATSACGLFGSGGTTLGLNASPRAPAAQGEVTTSRTSDQNTAISVRVKHLAPPDRIAQGATTYVVWIRPLGIPNAKTDTERQQVAGEDDTATIFNLGGLRIGKELDGVLETVTPYKSFELFITAEPSSAVMAPHDDRILWTTVSNQ